MGLPIYIQIHNTLKRKIEAGFWHVGQKIPPERQLAKEFNVSRMTLRQAVQTLVDEGVLERRVGSGTYVASSKVQEKMSGITSFTQLTKAAGKVPSSKVISYMVTPASLSEAEKLNLKQNDPVLRMERVRYADDVPICFEVASVPEYLIRDFERMQITSSLYQTLEHAGYKIGHAQQTVSAMLASERIADFLAIKRGDAILRLRQVTYLGDDTPFEYVRSQYAGNRFEFYLEK